MRIFSIDNVTDTHTLAKFLRHIDTQMAMGKMEGKIVQCYEMCSGQLRLCFIMTLNDFNTHVLNSGYVDNQVSFIDVPKQRRQPSNVTFQQDYPDVYMGRFVSCLVEPDTDFWMYRPDLNFYYFVEE